MNRLLKAAAIALVCVLGVHESARAQAPLTTITASSIKMGGKAIAVGTVTFTPVNLAGIPIAFDQGGGGLNSPDAFACTIVAGAITGTCQIPDSALTTQAHILYSIQVTNTASQKAFTFSTVPNITGATWALDAYAPPAQTTNVEPIQVAYGTAAPASSCVSPSFYVRNFAGGQLYMCVGGHYVLVISSGGGSGSGATIAVGSVAQLPAGSTPTVTNEGTSSDAIFDFGIPAGAQGATGLQGAKGDTGATGSQGTPGVAGSTGTAGTQGSTGLAGTAATIAVGTVTPLANGAIPTVTNVGSSSAATFNFGIPAGAAGAAGATGPQGLSGGSTNWRGAWVSTNTYVLDDAVSIAGSSYIAVATSTNVTPGTNSAAWQLLAQVGSAGATGTTGSQGTSATIAVGTVSPLASGATPTVTNVGTSSAATFNFGIPVGAIGATGTTGTAGTAATVSIGTVTPLAAGAAPTVTNAGSTSAATFNFGIPAGAAGATGTQGTTGTTGSPGTAATVAVGSVSTGAAGSSATVSNAGTTSAAVLNFTIPQGAAGATGTTGTPGTAATISVGSVLTGAAGSSATVTNAGTSSSAVLNFSVPQGAAGATGTTGTTGTAGAAATISIGIVTPLSPGATPTVTNSGTASAAVLAFGIPGTPTVIANVTVTLPTTAIAANTCTTAATKTMTGLATTSAFDTAFATNPNAVTGWGVNGGLAFTAWPSANTLNWSVCNQTSASITPGAMTLNVGAK
jgi:hypothetical protein